MTKMHCMQGIINCETGNVTKGLYASSEYYFTATC